MALSLVSSPSDYDVAYRDVEWSLDTSVIDLHSVKYELRNNITNALLATSNVQAIFGNDNRFMVNFASQIQDNLATDIDILTVNGTVVTSTNTVKQFRIEATEQILVSGQATDGATYTSAGVYINNGVLFQGDDNLVTQGYFSTASGTKLLTNKPIFDTRIGESEFVALFNNGENIKITVTVTDINGATTSGVVNSASASNKVSYVGIGYANINNLSLDTGAQPLLTGASASYTVEFETVTTGTVFESINVNIDPQPCSTNKRFHFQNVFGYIDSFTLTGYDAKGINVDSNLSVRTILNQTNAEQYGRFKSSSNKNTIFSVGTQNLTSNQRVWLEEMLSSSNIYIQDGSNYLPITINNSYFEITSNRFNKELFILEFEYQLANSLRRQKN